jgi:hypothetical protein
MKIYIVTEDKQLTELKEMIGRLTCYKIESMIDPTNFHRISCIR